MHQELKLNVSGTAGVCPKCGQFISDYGVIKVVDECVCYPFICSVCGTVGEEWYHLKFDRVEWWE